MPFSIFFEPGKLAIVATRAILGASRPDFRLADVGRRSKQKILILHSSFGQSLVPDFLHAVIVDCVVIPGGPKSMNTESGSAKLARLYQLHIYNRACAVLRKAYYAFWRNAETIIICKLRAYDLGIYSPFRTSVGEVSSESHRDLNIRNGFRHMSISSGEAKSGR